MTALAAAVLERAARGLRSSIQLYNVPPPNPNWHHMRYCRRCRVEWQYPALERCFCCDGQPDGCNCPNNEENQQ